MFKPGSLVRAICAPSDKSDFLRSGIPISTVSCKKIMVKPTKLGYYFYKVDMHAVKKYNYITITAQVLEPGLHYPSFCDCSLDCRRNFAQVNREGTDPLFNT